MEYNRLGATGLRVSELCLGSAHFGHGKRLGEAWDFSVEDADRVSAIVDRAAELGINFIDTANLYSGGDSERLIGQAIDGRRDEFVLGTKVGGKVAERPNGRGFSRRHVIEQIDRSLDRLGTDYIDLYQAHFWDGSARLGEALSAFEDIVRTGRARYIGACNFEPWWLMKALAVSEREGYEPFVSVQSEFSLIARPGGQSLLGNPFHELQPLCEDQGLGTVTYSPLAVGFLADAFDRQPDPPSNTRFEERPEQWERLNVDEHWAVLQAVREIAGAKDASPVEISVAWLLEKKTVDSVIIGPETVEELETYVAAGDISLTEQEVAALEAPLEE